MRRAASRIGGADISVLHIVSTKLGFAYGVELEKTMMSWDEELARWKGVVPNVKLKMPA